MIDGLLKKHLEPLARDHRRWRLYRGLTWCWASAGTIGIALILIRSLAGWSFAFEFPLLIACTVVAGLVVWRRTAADQIDYHGMARQIESEDPELHALLLTAVEQRPDKSTGELNYLQQRVIAEALAWKRRHLWEQISGQRLFFALCGQWAALVLLGIVLANLWTHRPAGSLFLFHGAEVANGVTVTPGDTSVERGSSLVVLARFAGRVPPEAALVVTPLDGNVRRIPLIKNLDDPVFGASIPEIKDSLIYRVEYTGGNTADYHVSVFEYPELQHADARIAFPEYTGLPEKTIVDTRRISAVEGSSLDYGFFLNKPVVSATLIDTDKSKFPLTPDTVHSNLYRANFTLDQSRQYQLVLVDDAGRTNKLPPQIVIDVLKNRPPELKFLAPGDQRVSPLEEIRFKAEASDDFGLRAYGIAFALAGQEPKSVELGQNAGIHEKRSFEYLLPLEDFAAQPDQLVSYYVWADDIGPDGKLRRTSSDMYFAEVRPFDEIFREGQQPEGGNGGGQDREQGGESEKLAELQKQIISATWNLERREVGPKPTPQFKKDVTVVQDSQKEALDQAQALKEKTDDPRTQALVDAAVGEMKKAVTHLTVAVNDSSPPALPPALSAEQSAYQSLLRLQAREYQVSRGRNQNGGRGGQRTQRQIDQLDLKTTENRYETQRQASQQQPAAQHEQLQVLSRLKELAQRQQDLNERLKELQTALQEAKTDEEREDVRRRLKRLREEEQEMMAGIDELNQRMSSPENQSRMADARRQLDQTRSEVQRATEALDNGAVSQALASGARAQRNLQQMSDDMRKKSSSQFAEDMRRMREEARQLAQRQEEAVNQLDSSTEAKRKTLGDSNANQREKLASQFDDQSKRLDQLLDHASQVTQQAENVEPLLSRQLYDMLRKNSQEDVRSLQETTDELLRSGQLARPVYDQLQKGKEESKRTVAVASELLRDGFAP
ncbi:MAG TPA: hypothetical protein VLU94_00385, partial [Candidatus Nitrosotalea sp.]|nr:hypothetical protein [Candidatus Nitrosotalea sp.]